MRVLFSLYGLTLKMKHAVYKCNYKFKSKCLKWEIYKYVRILENLFNLIQIITLILNNFSFNEMKYLFYITN